MTHAKNILINCGSVPVSKQDCITKFCRHQSLVWVSQVRLPMASGLKHALGGGFWKPQCAAMFHTFWTKVKFFNNVIAFEQEMILMIGWTLPRHISTRSNIGMLHLLRTNCCSLERIRFNVQIWIQKGLSVSVMECRYHPMNAIALVDASIVPRLGACATFHVPYLSRFVFGAKLTSKAQIQCIILTSTTVMRR